MRLALAGEVDVGGVSALEVAVKAAQADAPLVIVDLGGLAFLDVNGLRVLLDAHDRAQHDGHRLQIRSARGAVRKMLELTGGAERLEVVAAGAGDAPQQVTGASAREQLAAVPDPRRASLSVLEADPGLGSLLTNARRASAAEALVGSPLTLDMGEWDVKPFLRAGAAHVGLLVVDGFLARELLIQDQVSAELLGPGDVLRPWDDRDLDQGAPLFEIRWNVLAPTRLILLDRRFAIRLRDYPEVSAALFERLHQRSQRLAATKAIAQLINVERRLIGLFWHLAGRWGFVTRDGVVIPLTLTHRLLGDLVGARRPTVTTAVRHLTARGEMSRRADGTWLLRSHVAPESVAAARRIAPARRRFSPVAEAEGLSSDQIGV